MLDATIKIISQIDAVDAAEKKARPFTIKQAASYVRKVAINSMQFSEGPSKPGRPPHAHKGRLRRSILWAIDESGTADIGPSWDGMKRGGLPPYVGRIHERGGSVPTKRRKGATARKYPARPFMVPALEKSQERFARSFQGTIGQ